MKTLDEWIKEYEEKTGEEHTEPNEENKLKLYYVADRGYAEIGIFRTDNTEPSVVIYEVCGDAKFWHDFGVILCKQHNIKNILTVCIRAIEPYIRFWGWNIKERHKNKDGILARLRGTNQYGKSLDIGIAWRRERALKEKERYAYIVTSEVN